MKGKWVPITLIMVLLCMILPSSIACTESVTEYHLTVSSTEGGSVSKPGEGRYSYCEEQGDKVTLWAVASPGYRFNKWTGDVDTVANVDDRMTSITMNDDYSITANFVKLRQLTISSTAGGGVTTPGEGAFTYDESSSVKVVATPNYGYRFVKWSGDVGTMASADSASTTITVNKDYSITAIFVEQYQLAISSTDGGSVTAPGEGLHFYDAGVVSLRAEPDAGYRFVNWTGDVTTIPYVDAAATIITMNDDYSITANFVKLPHLTISSTDGGSVTAPGEGLYFYAGGMVNLVAEPDPGYRFVNWTGDVATIADVDAAATTIAMNDDYSITANFVEQYQLTISSTDGGSVTAPGEGLHLYDGGMVNLVAEPDAGYRFVNWTGDVSAIADVNDATTTITMNGHYSITANFRWTCEFCPK